MGLDMYLFAEVRIDQYDYEKNKDGNMSRRDNPDYDKVNEVMMSLPTGEYGGIRVSKCVAYWRKANAVHGWIVRNCAEGVDECQRIPMSREDLISLRDTCVSALMNRDSALPAQDDTKHIKGDLTTDDKPSMETFMSIMETIKAESDKITNLQELSKVIAIDDPTDPIPPTTGFFFGNAIKDEWYYESLADTAETINAILASDPEDTYSYYYQASW